MIRDRGRTEVTVTADALHGQKHCRSRRRDTGNLRLAPVKDNQPTLLANIATGAASSPPVDRIATVDRRRNGRPEHRTVAGFAGAGRLGPDGETATRITRLTWQKDTKAGLWQPLHSCPRR